MSRYVMGQVTRDSDYATFDVLGRGSEPHDGKGMVCLRQTGHIGYDRVTDASLAQNFTAFPAPSTRLGRGAVRFEVNLTFGDEDLLGTADRALSGLVAALQVLGGPLPEGYRRATLAAEDIADAHDSYPSARFLDMVDDGSCAVADLAFMARVMNRYAEMVARTVGE